MIYPFHMHTRTLHLSKQFLRNWHHQDQEMLLQHGTKYSRSGSRMKCYETIINKCICVFMLFFNWLRIFRWRFFSAEKIAGDKDIQMKTVWDRRQGNGENKSWSTFSRPWISKMWNFFFYDVNLKTTADVETWPSWWK